MAHISLHVCFSQEPKHRAEALMAEEWSVLQHHRQLKAVVAFIGCASSASQRV